MEVLVQPMQSIVQIADGGPTLAVQPQTTRLDITAPGPQGAQGIPGPQGLPGNAAIGGLPVQITNPMPGDVLQLSATSAWTNSQQDAITDGGNF
ncbi:hypothetical protein [Limnohabitans sp.]